MAKSILEPILHLVVIIPVVLFLMNFEKRKCFHYLLLFCAFFLLNQILLMLPFHAKALKIFSGNWNWSGKIYAVAGSMIFYFLFRNKFRENDFVTLHLAKNSFKPNLIITTAVALLALLAGYFVFSKAAFNSEKLAFQFFMPGIEEEIAYRGIMIGILMTFLKSEIKIAGKSIGHPAIWVTAILFAIVHALQVSSISPTLQLKMNWSFFGQTIVFGYLLGWMAMKSRSILMPVIAHNAANFFRNLAMMIK